MAKRVHQRRLRAAEFQWIAPGAGPACMGRKNGKTALIAMLLLVHLCGPEAIRNGQLYSVAFDREQAAIVFKYAAAMVYASDGTAHDWSFWSLKSP